jgi:3-methyladenine DNA glycosylase AlkD
MINPYHEELLKEIKEKSGKGTQHTLLDSYLGNTHPRYPIAAPVLRTIAKTWMKAHRDLSSKTFSALLTSLIEGESSTEKVMAGILMDYATLEQGSFHPKIFDTWLNHLEGWAEVDAVCTGAYMVKQLPVAWTKWEPVLHRLSKAKNLQKQRASLVLLCSPVSHVTDDALVEAAFKNIDRLKAEKHLLITKAISWLLRSMVRHQKELVTLYVNENAGTLPAIAVRETRMVLKTGKKTKRHP